jgi:hypothetical protein
VDQRLKSKTGHCKTIVEEESIGYWSEQRFLGYDPQSRVNKWKIKKWGLGVAVHACNPSYVRGGDWKVWGPRSVLGKSNWSSWALVVTQEAEIKRFALSSQSGQIVLKPILWKTHLKEGEWFKWYGACLASFQVLDSDTSIAKKDEWNKFKIS